MTKAAKSPSGQDLYRALESALANQRLAGLEPDARVVADLYRVADGSLTIQQVVDDIHRRIRAGEFGAGAGQPSE